MDLTTCKILVMVLLGVIKLLSGLLPMLITKILRKKSRRCLNRLIGVVLCLGGGVLLSTVFLHILPEVREMLESSNAVSLVHLREHYPLAELVLCLGFLGIFLLETIVCKLFGLGHSHGHGVGGGDSGHSHGHTAGGEEQMSVSVNSKNSKNNSQGSDRPDDSMVPMVHSHNETTRPIRPMPFIGSTQFESDKNVYNVSSATLVFSTSFSDLSLDTISGSGPPSSPLKSLKKVRFVSSIRSFLVVLALSIHSVFEGMAIGLQDNERGVWKLFIAVSVHATAIVFCIGMEMISTGMKKLQIVFYVTVLSVVTPIGVAIGLMVSFDADQSGDGDFLVTGILQGVAGGTLLYITFFEVLDREKLGKYKMSGMVGILAILVGFGAMASMEVMGGHSHSHLEKNHGHAHMDEAHGHAHVDGHAHGYDRLNGGHIHVDEGLEFNHLNGGRGQNPLNHLFGHNEEEHGHDHLNEENGHDHVNGGHVHDHLNEQHGHDHLNGGNVHDHLSEEHGHVHDHKDDLGKAQMHGDDDHIVGVQDHGHVGKDGGHIHMVGEKVNDHTAKDHADIHRVGKKVQDHTAKDHGDIHGVEENVQDHKGEDHEHIHMVGEKVNDHTAKDHGGNHRVEDHKDHKEEDHEHIHMVGDQRHEHVGGNHQLFVGEKEHDHAGGPQGIVHNVEDHRFAPVREDKGPAHVGDHAEDTHEVKHGEEKHGGDRVKEDHAKYGHGDNHAENKHINDHAEHTTGDDHDELMNGDNHDQHRHRDAHADDIQENTSAIIEAQGDTIVEVVDHNRHGGLSDDKASKHDHVNLDDKDKQYDNKTIDIVNSDSEDFQHEQIHVQESKDEGEHKLDPEVFLEDKNTIDNERTMHNDEAILDKAYPKPENKIIKVIFSEENSVLFSPVDEPVNNNQAEDDTLIKVDDMATTDDVASLNTDLNFDIINDVHKCDKLVIKEDNTNISSLSDTFDKNHIIHDDKKPNNQTSDQSEKQLIVQKEILNKQSNTSVKNISIQEEINELNSDIIDDHATDNFEEVPILNNTAEVFFDYNEIVDNDSGDTVKKDSPVLDLIQDLEINENVSSLVNETVFFEDSTDDKSVKHSIKESDEHQPWWTTFF